MAETILVTGCGGFLGRHIADALEANGYFVYRHHRKVNSPCNEGMLCGDLAVADEYSTFPTAVDGLVHAAGYVPRAGATESESEALRGNVLATYHLLQWAMTHQVKRFVLCSTLAVYGVSGTKSFGENDRALPHSLYAITKRCAETLILAEEDGFLRGSTVLRLSTLVGPGVAPVHFIPAVAWRLRNEQDVVLFGNPNNLVDYMHVNDAARGVRLALESSVSGVFNIGSGIPVRLDELAEIVCTPFPAAATKVRTSWNPDLPTKTAILNPEKAASYLGFRISMSPLEAIRYYLQQEFGNVRTLDK